MSEQPPSAIGTVAQEAARLIEDMATMARSSNSRADDPSPHAGRPAYGPFSPDAQPSASASDIEAGIEADTEAADDFPEEPCGVCGGERDDTPASCRLCPLCQGIALLRSVRPETVDLLADLALSMAASLRDVAARSRASDPASSGRSGSSGRAPDADRDHVQDIPVDDESER
ncbi:MAG: hypothetical protein QOE58_2904 [Actinomycetota bacterium]|jgi:hypothetical protein|nr:hypothetical protein [Actinomycetota bacterium]